MAKAVRPYRGELSDRIGREKREIDGLYIRADPISNLPDEVASDLARYLCIRVCGHLETIIEMVVDEVCYQKSSGVVREFATSWLKNSPNPSAENIEKLFRRFGSEVENRIVEFLDRDESRSRLNSLLGLRNQLAHGKSVGVSRDQAWEYYKVVDGLTEILTDWCKEATGVSQ